MQPLDWMNGFGRTWGAQSSMAEMEAEENRRSDESEDNEADSPRKLKWHSGFQEKLPGLQNRQRLAQEAGACLLKPVHAY